MGFKRVSFGNSLTSSLSGPFLRCSSDYPSTPYQALGVLTFVFATVLFLVGFDHPEVYYPFRLPEGHFALDPEGERARGHWTKQQQAEDTHEHAEALLCDEPVPPVPEDTEGTPVKDDDPVHQTEVMA